MGEFDQNLSTEEIENTRARRQDDELDLTPMVDVTFLLLIFFMITAAFAVQKAISVPPISDEESAQSQPFDELEDDSIVVRVDADNVYWIGAPRWTDEQRALSASEMNNKLREARGDDGQGPTKLLVQANGDARHGSVVAVLDAGSGAGIEQISLMSYEEGDLGL